MTGPSSRMLTLLSLLQARRDWPGGALAGRLGVTTRTVRRDVDRLRELGYQISAVKGPDGGYRLAAGSELPPLLFDDEQAVALAVALQHAPSSGVDIDEAAARALATVRQVMPSRLRHRVDGVQFSRAGARAGVGNRVLVDPGVLETVSEAVRLRRVLRFDYETRAAGEPGAGTEPGPVSQTGAVTGRGAVSGTDVVRQTTPGPARRAEPHGLVARTGLWYLVAYDLDRDDWRIFRLDRLAPRTPAGAVFAPRPVPTGDPVTFLAARAKGATEADLWPCVGQVEIDLPAAEVLPWARDWQVEPVSAQGCRVTAGSWSWHGLLADLLRLDAPFRVVGPTALADEAEAVAGRLSRAVTP